MAQRSLVVVAGLILAVVLPAPAAAAPVCAVSGCEAPVALPFELPFSADADEPAVGFRLTEPGAAGEGLRRELLAVDGGAGLLRVTTTAGIAYRALNSQENMLGVTVPAADRAIVLETTLVAPPPGTGAYEQAGLWYGTSQRDYVKLVLISHPLGLRAHLLQEAGDLVKTSIYGPVAGPAPSRVTLRLRIDPADGSLTGAYVFDDGRPVQLRRTPFSAGLRELAAGGQAVSRAGIFATHRRARAPVSFAFDEFRVRCAVQECPPGPAPPDPGIGDGTEPVGEPGDEESARTVTPRPPSGGGDGATLPPPPSAAPPAVRGTLSLSVRRRTTLRNLRLRGVRGRLRCSKACVVRVDVLARHRRGSRLRRVGRTRMTIDAPGSRRLAVVLSRRGGLRLKGVSRLVVRASAGFADGDTAVASRRIRVGSD